METIKTDAYDIIIKNNLFTMINELAIKRCHVLVDSNVYSLYVDTITRAFSSTNHTITIIQAGEDSKSFDTLEKTIQALMEKEVKREDTLIALGGGVIGDLTGFIASILFRGIDYIQIPTTLLSMVDSSVGGKTAINIAQGKNLVGAFHAPKKVIIDPSFLTTLPKKELRSGLSEALKAALIGDHILLELLKKDTLIDSTLIARAIKVKLSFTEQDYRDYSVRHTLNFGHTYGHAIEHYYKYKITHGEAVAQGMLMALELGVKKQMTPPSLLEDVKNIIDNLNLITLPKIDKEQLIPYMKYDKKSSKDAIRFVFLKAYQKPIIKTLTWDELL